MKVDGPQSSNVRFSHVHLYADKLEDLETYKDYERRLCLYHEKVEKCDSIDNKISLWKQLNGSCDTDSNAFTTQNRDIVMQLLAGFGFRIVGYRYGATTRSVLVTSKDPKGVQFVISAPHQNDDCSVSDEYHHFRITNLSEFLAMHNNRQGIAVLAFTCKNVDDIYKKYKEKHPALIAHYYECDDAKILQVYAYYLAHLDGDCDRVADKGTKLRFIQSASADTCALPGLQSVDAQFDSRSQPAYCDHWVSNVVSRTEFLTTLEDTLGFTPKVDFNAGVVSAGEAQIESTVTGNTSKFITSNPQESLQDQSQVYLPINNALTEVGHVHGFLKEVGQGIQHIASRVENIIDFVSQSNENRKVFHEGFTFLDIPRSYYGVLTNEDLADNSELDVAVVDEIMQVLVQKEYMDPDGAVRLQIDYRQLDECLRKHLGSDTCRVYDKHESIIASTILQSRYKNLKSLLGDRLDEDEFLGIVRNKILVDIQGGDILYQIFTCKILQRHSHEEAPFLEFIQRVCKNQYGDSSCGKIKPGCGGFGIRNFLTLFLSIEVSKAMHQVVVARQSGDVDAEEYAATMVELFTSQLNESNPILTEISDAMTYEGELKERLEVATADDDTVKEIQDALKDAAMRKNRGNERLLECSNKYNTKMRQLRESQK